MRLRLSGSLLVLLAACADRAAPVATPLPGSAPLAVDLGGSSRIPRIAASAGEGEGYGTMPPVAQMDHSKMDHSKMGHDMSQMDHGQHQHEMAPGMTMVNSRAPNAAAVPGYPQDMAVVMDELVAKPETHGLRPTWTMGMMGMMTMVRVLPPEQYDEILALKPNWQPNETQRRFREMQQNPTPAAEHHHHDE
jgi:hypothetical protein